MARECGYRQGKPVWWVLLLALYLTLLPFHSLGSDPERGLGGTGMTPPISQLSASQLFSSDRGLGGTGIIGTISAFGSIWVNGVEIELTSSTQLLMDGAAATEADLRVGQQVKVLTRYHQGEVVAATVLIEHQLIAVVEGVAADGSEILLLGQRVQRAPLAPGVWPSVRLGDTVRISGYHGADQTLLATDVMPIAKSTEWMIKGRLRGDAAGNRAIGTVVLGELGVGIELGDRITVSGVWREDKPLVTQLSRPSALPFRDAADRYLIDSRGAAGGLPRRVGIALVDMVAGDMAIRGWFTEGTNHLPQPIGGDSPPPRQPRMEEGAASPADQQPQRPRHDVGDEDRPMRPTLLRPPDRRLELPPRPQRGPNHNNRP